MVGGSLRVLRLLPPLKLIAMILLKVALNIQKSRSISSGVLATTLRDKVYQWLATSRCFSPGTPVSSTNKTDCHDITEILFKVALSTITHTHTHTHTRTRTHTHTHTHGLKMYCDEFLFYTTINNNSLYPGCQFYWRINLSTKR